LPLLELFQDLVGLLKRIHLVDHPETVSPRHLKELPNILAGAVGYTLDHPFLVEEFIRDFGDRRSVNAGSNDLPSGRKVLQSPPDKKTGGSKDNGGMEG
jgi:hypothetical protein